MIPPITKAERVAFARCWGLWVRWLRLEKSITGLDRALLYRLMDAIREEMRDE